MKNFRLLLTLAAFAMCSLLPAANVTELSAAAAKQKYMDVVRISTRICMELQHLNTETMRAQVQREATAIMSQQPTAAALERLIEEIQVAAEQKDDERIYLKARQIGFLAMRLDMKNAPDPMIAYESAKKQAVADPSFINLYGLAFRANVAKQYPASLDAAKRALELGATDRVALASSEGFHAVSLLAADASLALGNVADADRFLLTSLDSPANRWIQACPNWHTADKLLDANRREAVIAYFEKAYTQPFPKCKESISLWIGELKAGKRPNFSPPNP